jgi:hypothetical protein
VNAVVREEHEAAAEPCERVGADAEARTGTDGAGCAREIVERRRAAAAAVVGPEPVPRAERLLRGVEVEPPGVRREPRRRSATPRPPSPGRRLAASWRGFPRSTRDPGSPSPPVARKYTAPFQSVKPGTSVSAASSESRSVPAAVAVAAPRMAVAAAQVERAAGRRERARERPAELGDRPGPLGRSVAPPEPRRSRIRTDEKRGSPEGDRRLGPRAAQERRPRRGAVGRPDGPLVAGVPAGEEQRSRDARGGRRHDQRSGHGCVEQVGQPLRGRRHGDGRRGAGRHEKRGDCWSVPEREERAQVSVPPECTLTNRRPVRRVVRSARAAVDSSRRVAST